MNSKEITSFQETYELPSKGLLYSNKDDLKEITLRSMTTFEEKMRLGSQSFYTKISNILDSIVTSPENFNAKEMTIFDFNFLMYKMRTVSYGPTYKVNITCPHCGNNVLLKINLDDLKVNYLDEKQEEPFTIGPLPRTGDIIGCKHLRVKDLMNIERRAKEILSKSKDYVGDPEYILRMAAWIKTINGEEVHLPEAEHYIEKLNAMDSAYLSQKYGEATDNVGIDTTVESECPVCGGELSFGLPLTGEFFRPTYD